MPLEEHSVVVLRTWWQWFLRKKTLNLAQETFLGGKKKKVPNAFPCLTFSKDGMDSGLSRSRWILALSPDLSFLPAPDSLCCLGCGPQFLLSPLLTLGWCSPYLCCRPVCLCTAKRLSTTPTLISSSRRALAVLALAWPLAISRLPVLVILPSSRAAPSPSDLTPDSTSPKTPLNPRSG